MQDPSASSCVEAKVERAELHQVAGFVWGTEHSEEDTVTDRVRDTFDVLQML